MKTKFIFLLSAFLVQLWTISMSAQKPSSTINVNEKLRATLTQYVTEGKIFETSKIENFNKACEFGNFTGENAAGNIYEGKNYSLILSFEWIDSSHKKINDFLLDEKGKLFSADASYSSCAIYKNLKINNRGFPTSDGNCAGVSVVKLKTPEAECMTAIPIVKAWKKEANGKFIEIDATGLTWWDECP